jgi:hypothetical protein
MVVRSLIIELPSTRTAASNDRTRLSFSSSREKYDAYTSVVGQGQRIPRAKHQYVRPTSDSRLVIRLGGGNALCSIAFGEASSKRENKERALPLMSSTWLLHSKLWRRRRLEDEWKKNGNMASHDSVIFTGCIRQFGVDVNYVFKCTRTFGSNSRIGLRFPAKQDQIVVMGLILVLVFSPWMVYKACP